MNGPSTRGANPFPGLRPFSEDEEHLFFGRERQVDAMIDKLAATHFLAVVGSSGSGKSSLVNCGLRPALHRGLMAAAGTRWRVAQFRPGSRPVAALARALVTALPAHHDGPGPFSPADFVETTLRLSKLGLVDVFEQAGLASGTNLLVVADQFEELFRYTDVNTLAGADGRACGRPSAASEDAMAFVNLLLNAAAQREVAIYVVLTMRADFLGDCAQFFGLPEAINGGQYLLPRLTRDERRLAIAGPIGVGGAQIAPVLLTRLVNDVGDNPDQLSILQHALNRTWARWTEQSTPQAPIDLAHYEQIGTMAKALDQHAEEAFASLASAPRKALCERLFKALTDRSTDLRGVRRPTRLDALGAITAAPQAEVAAVIETFREPGRGFLMPPACEPLAPESVIDISHESLMRVWERLRRWATAESESVDTYLRLSDRAERQAIEGLLSGPTLQLTLAWRRDELPNGAWAAQYHAGFDAAIRFLNDSEDAARIALRHKRMRTAATALLTVGLVTFALFGFYQRDQAQSLQDANNASEARELAARAEAQLASGRIDLALLFAAQGWKVGHVQQAQDVLLAALRDAPRFVLAGHLGRVSGVAFSPDNRTLASISDDGTAVLWNVADGTLRTNLARTRETPTQALAFAPDGSRLMAVNLLNVAGAAWDTKGGTPRAAAAAVAAAPDTDPDIADAVQLDAAQGIGVSAVAENLSVWNLADGQRRALLTFPGEGVVTSLAIDRDGRQLAAARSSGAIELMSLVDPGAPHRPLRIDGKNTAIDTIAFSRDGSLLASTAADGGVVLWRVADGQLLASQAGFIDEASADRVPAKLAFSPDGQTLAWAGSNGTLVIWALPGLDYRQVVQAHQGPVERIAFGPNSDMLASAGRDGVVRLWNLLAGTGASGSTPVPSRKLLAPLGRPMKGHPQAVNDIVFSPDGRWLASGGSNLVLLWDVSRTQPWRGPLKDPLQAINCVAFSPKGNTIVSGNDGGNITLWTATGDIADLQQLPEGHTDVVQALAFSSDGRWLASASEDKQVMLWDMSTRTRLATLPGDGAGQGKGFTSVAFRTVDDKLLAAGDRDGLVRLWAVPGGALLATINHSDGVWSVSFSPDGKTLAVAGQGDKVGLWDVSSPASPRFTRELAGSRGTDITSVSFSPDGRTLAAGDLKGAALLWNVATGTRRQVAPMQHAKGIWSVAYSHSGKVLATASLDKTARLWDAATGLPLTQPLTGHQGRVWKASFSPDDKTLATAGGDQTVMLWDADVVTWESRACRVVKLHADEWLTRETKVASTRLQATVCGITTSVLTDLANLKASAPEELRR